MDCPVLLCYWSNVWLQFSCLVVFVCLFVLKLSTPAILQGCGGSIFIFESSKLKVQGPRHMDNHYPVVVTHQVNKVQKLDPLDPPTRQLALGVYTEA